MYKLAPGGVILGNKFIPEAEGNADWQTYLQWLAAGNTPQPADILTADAGQVAQGGARQWFTDNPQTTQLFTLSIPELETEIINHVNALFPSATAQLRARETKIRMAQLVAIRITVKRELS